MATKTIKELTDENKELKATISLAKEVALHLVDETASVVEGLESKIEELKENKVQQQQWAGEQLDTLTEKGNRIEVLESKIKDLEEGAKEQHRVYIDLSNQLDEKEGSVSPKYTAENAEDLQEEFFSDKMLKRDGMKANQGTLSIATVDGKSAMTILSTGLAGSVQVDRGSYVKIVKTAYEVIENNVSSIESVSKMAVSFIDGAVIKY